MILGGRVAGCTTVSLVATVLGKIFDITLAESDRIGTVGAGKAKLPSIINFNPTLGLYEQEFLQITKGIVRLVSSSIDDC